MNGSYLFLKPVVKTPDGKLKQMQDIERFIKPAIIQAQLSPLDDNMDGLVVSEISEDLVQRVYKADVIIIDANCYETSGSYQFSHYLYYYMAIGHMRGNITILVMNTSMRAYLPPKLFTHHTILYSSEEIWQFINDFKAKVEEILRTHGQGEPDNPIQGYRTREELVRARQQIADLEAEKAARARQKQMNQPITFRKVGGW